MQRVLWSLHRSFTLSLLYSLIVDRACFSLQLTTAIRLKFFLHSLAGWVSPLFYRWGRSSDLSWGLTYRGVLHPESCVRDCISRGLYISWSRMVHIGSLCQKCSIVGFVYPEAVQRIAPEILSLWRGWLQDTILCLGCWEGRPTPDHQRTFVIYCISI